MAGNLDSLDNFVARRGQVASSQSPIAVIVSCSDSRVPPELVFDQTLGEVFVVRTAGQVIDEAARSSIVYAVDFLKAPLVVVMGHSRCGAVEAAVAAIQGTRFRAMHSAWRKAMARPCAACRDSPATC